MLGLATPDRVLCVQSSSESSTISRWATGCSTLTFFTEAELRISLVSGYLSLLIESMLASFFNLLTVGLETFARAYILIKNMVINADAVF